MGESSKSPERDDVVVISKEVKGDAVNAAAVATATKSKRHIPVNKPRGIREKGKSHSSGRRMKDKSSRSDTGDLDGSTISHSMMSHSRNSRKSSEMSDESALSRSVIDQSSAMAMDGSGLSHSEDSNAGGERRHRRKPRRDADKSPTASHDSSKEKHSDEKQRRRRLDKSPSGKKRESSLEKHKDAEKSSSERKDSSSRRRRAERTKSAPDGPSSRSAPERSKSTSQPSSSGRRVPDRSRSAVDTSASSTAAEREARTSLLEKRLMDRNSKVLNSGGEQLSTIMSVGGDELSTVSERRRPQRRTTGKAAPVTGDRITAADTVLDKASLAERRRRRTALLDASRDGSDASERRRLPSTPTRPGSATDNGSSGDDADVPADAPAADAPAADAPERTARRYRRSERISGAGADGIRAPNRRHRTSNIPPRTRSGDDTKMPLMNADDGSSPSGSILKRPPALRRAATDEKSSPVRSSIRERRASRKSTHNVLTSTSAAQALVNAVDHRTDILQFDPTGSNGGHVMAIPYTTTDDDNESITTFDKDEGHNDQPDSGSMDHSGSSLSNSATSLGIDNSERSKTSTKIGLKKMLPTAFRFPWKSSKDKQSVTASALIAPGTDESETANDLDG